MSNENSPNPAIVNSPDKGSGSSNPDHAREVIRRIKENHLEFTAYQVIDLPRFKFDDALEKAGVLPVPVDPNPYDIEIDERLYDKWLTDHPVESEAHHQLYERRENIEELLYYGSRLNEISGGRMYNTWSLPEKFTRESIASFIKKEQDASMFSSWMIEDRLKKEGLLEVLEASGVIPNKGTNEKNMEPSGINRVEALSYLHTGAVLNILNSYLKKMRIVAQ